MFQCKSAELIGGALHHNTSDADHVESDVDDEDDDDVDDADLSAAAAAADGRDDGDTTKLSAEDSATTAGQLRWPMYKIFI